MATGLFDDLLPGAAAGDDSADMPAFVSTGLFDDLIPKPRGAIGETAAAVARGAVGGVGEMLTGAGAVAGQEPGAGIRGAGERVSAYGRKTFPASKGREESFFTNELPETVGGIIPAAGAMGAAALLGAPAAVGVGGGALLFGAQGAGSAAEQAAAQGATPGQQQAAALAGAAINAPMALIPGGQITRGASRFLPSLAEEGVRGGLARTGAAAAEGAALGAGGQIAGNEAAREIYDPNRDLTQGAGKAALLTGGAMGLLHPVLGAGAPRREPPTPEPEILPPEQPLPALPPPPIYQGGPERPSHPLALPAPRERNVADEAWLAGQHAAAGGTLGPNTGQPNQFVIPDVPTAPTGRFGEAVNYFMNKGLTRDQSIGVVSRLHAESGLDPNIVNPSSGATGIAQWLDRRPAMEASGASGDFGKQLDYIWHEFNTSERRAFNAVKRTDNAADAARAMEMFERAGNPSFTESAAQLAAHVARTGEMPEGRVGGHAGDVIDQANATADQIERQAALPAPEPMLALPRSETIYGDNFLMKPSAPTPEAAPAPQPTPKTPLDLAYERAVPVIATMDAGTPVTRARLAAASGITTGPQLDALRSHMIQQGIVTRGDNGRYVRAVTVNEPDALAARNPVIPTPASPPVAPAAPVPLPRSEPVPSAPAAAPQPASVAVPERPLPVSPAPVRAEMRAPAPARPPPIPAPEAPLARPVATPEQRPDTKPGNYYVTAIRDGKQVGYLAGPYRDDHASALAAVERTREVANKVDPFSEFDAFGTARTNYDFAQPGRLNEHIGDVAPKLEPPPAAAPEPAAPRPAVMDSGWRPTDLGPPALEPRQSKINTGAPTQSALESSLNRADETRNLPRLSPEQAQVAEGARAEMARRFDEAATQAGGTPIGDWQASAQEHAERRYPAAPGRPPTQSRVLQRRGFMDQILGRTREGGYNRDYSEGSRDAEKWLADNPRPDVGTVEVRVPHGRGGETVLTLPRDEQIIRNVAERYNKLPDHSLYQRPDVGASAASQGFPTVESQRASTAPGSPAREMLRQGLYQLVRERAPSLRLRTFDELIGQIEGRPSPIWGSYHQEYRPGGLIEHIASIGLHRPDPRGALTHEIVHFFRGAGLFTRQEWGALGRKVDDWIKQFKIGERYPDLPETVRREEAVAEAYSAWDRGEMQHPPGIRRIFGKAKDFIERTGNWLRGNGYQTAEDVFRRADTGEIGGRAETEPTIAGEPLHQRPASVATDEQRADLNRIMHTDRRTLTERVRGSLDGLRDDMASRFKQSFIDDTTGTERMEKATSGGRLRDASVSPTWMQRLTRNLDSVMQTVIGVKRGDNYLGGALRYNTKEGAFETLPGSKSFAEIFKPVFDSGKQDLFALWAITRRAGRLMAEGREHNVSAADIAKYRNLDQQHPEFRGIMADWRMLNKRTLDLAEDRGVINREQRKLFESDDYVPFYRAIEDDVASPRGGKGVANVRSGIRRLTGGEEKVADIYENMVRNLTALVDRSMRNEAMRRVVQLGGGTDFLTPMSKVARESLDTPEAKARLQALGLDPAKMSADAKNAAADLFGMMAKKDKNLVSVMENGKAQYYRVNDPLLLRSLVSMGPQAVDGLAQTILKGAARLLRNTITIDPAFMAANLLRDSLHSWVVTGHGFTPGVDTMKGFVSAYRNSPSAMALMAGGAGGGHFYGAAPEHVRRTLESKGFKDSVIDTPRKAWNALQHIGQASEQANRIAIYEDALKNGASKAEAIARAQDVLNFTMRGDSAAMRFLTETVPFMNARIQGAHRLYRGLKENPKAFLLRGAMIAGAATALWAANHNDPRYQALEDWDRQNYFHFFLGDTHLRLPKPFEVGAIFANIPEMLYDYSDTGSLKHLRDAFVSNITQQLQMDPTPQLLKPVVDLYANKDSFTGRPIVNEAEARLMPGLRYGPHTSQTMIALGKTLGVSPDQAEHLLRGYTGTLGTYMLAASDALADAVGATPPQPTKRLDQMPVVQRFIREEPALANRYITEFYDLKKNIDELVASANKFRKEGDAASLKKLVSDTENQRLMGLHEGANQIGNRLADIRRAEQQIMQHPTMLPDEKRRRLDDLLTARNTIGMSARPMLRVGEGLTATP